MNFQKLRNKKKKLYKNSKLGIANLEFLCYTQNQVRQG